MPGKPAYVTANSLKVLGLPVRDRWRLNARCIGQASVMDPPRRKLDGESRELATAICRACPVLADCRDWVLNLPYGADPGGVCAALTEGERARRRVTSKRCPTCEQVLPGIAFHANNRFTDGLQTHCIACVRTRKHLERNPT